MTDQELKQLFQTVGTPEKTATTPEKTATAPEKTATAPEKTATAPEKTAAAPVTPDIPLAQSAKKPGDTVTAGGRSFTVEEVIGTGAEGDIYLVSDKKRKYALKICRPGYKTNEKVLEALQNMQDKNVHIPRIESWGPDYELMEYFPAGSVAKSNLKGNAQAITAIVVKIAIALDCMHRAGVIHKDVKPANILIRRQESWDVVLCDFGIAGLTGPDGRCKTTQARTRIYAAPEVYAKDNTIVKDGVTYCELTPKADFYSLGMTILSLWLGEGAFMAKEHEMALDKLKGRIAIPPDMPDPLARICRGLLISDPEKRWNLGEIERAIDGEDVPVEEDLINPDLNIVFNATRHKKADTPKELAACMAEDPELAARYLYNGQIERWLRPYTELALEINDITEKRFPRDHKTGVQAAIFFLDPEMSIHLSGTLRAETTVTETDAVTLKDVSNFCAKAEPDAQTADLISSEIFRQWVMVRSKDIAAKLPTSTSPSATYLLRIQTIDPLSDINLNNDPESDTYSMTGEGLGCFLNEIYTVFWNVYEGDLPRMRREWQPDWILKPVAINIVSCFLAPEDNHYITEFFDTKGQHFKDQRQWYVYCTDRNSDEYINRAGPKDDIYHAQASWMKCIQGYGWTPEYEFVETEKIAYDHKTLFSHSKKELREEYRKHGLKGFLAVLNHEDPDADLSEEFAYEDLLHDYLEDIRAIDPQDKHVKRFDKAAAIADDLLDSGRGKIRLLNARNITQMILSIVLAIIPALALLTMLIFSIIEHPLVDVSSFKIENWIWVLGLIIGAIIYFSTDWDGCLPAIIAGVVCSFLLMAVVKFLGMFILYFYAAIVLGVLIWFSIKTIFNRSPFADQARKFTKPGFEEQVLEPLYFAFSDEDSFDSSLNGAFNDSDIQGWKQDLKFRRTHTLVFVAAVWLLMIFSSFIPKSERFDKLSAPVIELLSPDSKTEENEMQ